MSAGPLLTDEGERKQVSVLFADIRGSTQLIETLDPEAAMGQLDPALEVMAQSVRRFGGVVNSVRGDGIMALFGVPAACEDHAVRACLAAQKMLELAEGLADDAIRIRVGIDSGEVVIRATGTDASDYDATGAVAHLANRVEQQARPGTACVTGRTARLARGHVEVAPLGRVAVKGFTDPIEIFELLEATPRSTWEARSAAQPLSAFVGRGAEMLQLSAALGRAGIGSGQVVAILADAGFGKSRLAHEFLSDLPVGSWNVLGVAAVSHMVAAPWRLAADLLRAVLSVDPHDDRSEVGLRLAHTMAVLDPAARVDLAPLQSLLDLPVDDDGWSGLAPPVRRDRTIAALRTVVLLEAAMRPVVLLVEDYQWVDSPSAQVLDAIVESMGAARFLLVVTTRPESCPSWTRRSYCLQIQLTALESDHAGRMLRELVGPATGLEELRLQILEQAGGIPLFIEEIAHSLLETGVLGKDARAPSHAVSPAVHIPASVQGIIASRIDRLPSRRKRLLQVASVIGKDVPYGILAAVADLAPDDLDDELAKLQSAEFLYELSIRSGRAYTFRHALIQTVAYEEMLRKTRRELHARVLAALQAQIADRQDELTEQLVDHALRGEVWPEAVRYALKAGDRATGRWAWRSAIRFYDQAIEALRHLPEDSEDNMRAAMEARLRLRVALPGVADLPRIARCLDEARSLAVKLNDSETIAEIETSQCLTQTKMGLLSQAIDAGRRACVLGRELGDKSRLLSATFALAQADWYVGSFQEARSLIEPMMAEIQGDLRLRNTGTTGTASLLSLVCLGKTHAITGNADAALATMGLAAEVARDSGKPFDRSYCSVGEGFRLLMAGDHEGAVIALEEALSIARAADVGLLIPSSQRYLGRAYALAGRHDDARRILADAIARTTASGLVGMRLWSQGALVLTMMRGDIQAASSLLEETLDHARVYGFRPLEAYLLQMAGRLQARADASQLRDSELLYRRAEAMAMEMGMRPLQASVGQDLNALLACDRRGLDSRRQGAQEG